MVAQNCSSPGRDESDIKYQLRISGVAEVTAASGLARQNVEFENAKKNI